MVMDASIQAMALAIDELARGFTLSMVKDTNGIEHVDFNEYLRKATPIPKEDVVREEPASPIVTATDDEVHIFGGTGDVT